jgi:valyl-tRNA synthetase
MMSDSMLDKNFDPAKAEQRIYAAWEDSGAFQPKYDDNLEAYSIVIPPPNVTGSLHMGHALNVTLQDILIRFERLRGKDVLWQPGMDHAGIATQMVVERQLAEEGNVGRKDMLREDFIARVWEWKEQSGGTIQNQTKRLGASCDWSRSRFTMDEDMSDAVRKVFVRMYEEGLIYRDKRLVNWDTHFETAISNVEVENVETDGHFWHFKYPLEGGETYEYVEKDEDGNITLRETRDYISIATTRPETMLGDGAVAVHPSDERYKSIVGKRVLLPLADRYIPIITDRHPDPDLGSGAVKITGAHDFNDYEVAKRHDLPLHVIMDTKGRMQQSQDVEGKDIMPAKYVGMDRFAARKAVVADIKAIGQLEKVEDRKVQVPTGDRSNTVIEPMLTDQWYVNAKKLAEEAIEAVDDGRTEFHPASYKKTYDQWMHNIEPWCISRQLWWGHRVPVWYGPNVPKGGFLANQKAHDEANKKNDGYKIFVANSWEEAVEQAKEYYDVDEVTEGQDSEGFNTVSFGISAGLENGGGKVTKVTLSRDPDVLDTWFSSGLWPFATMGWPEDTDDLKRFYPTSVVVTAFDIIFFWVARMMMQGLHLTNKVPFEKVYIHAIVRDEHGKKMSKSKGNVVSPQKIMKTLGADILRLWVSSTDYTGEVSVSDEILKRTADAYRRIRNTARFMLANMDGFEPTKNRVDVEQMLPLDRWITVKAEFLQQEIIAAYEQYDFHLVYQKVHNFCAMDLGAFYLDVIKDRQYTTQADSVARRSAQTALHHIIEAMSRWIAPILSFTAEELWGFIPGERTESIFFETWYQFPPEIQDEMDDAYWQQVLKVRVACSKEMEKLRVDKTIGSSLDAEIDLYCDETTHTLLSKLDDELRFVLITSDVHLHNLSEKPADAVLIDDLAGLALTVKASEHTKCVRCWHHRDDVGQHSEHPELCGRCVDNVSGDGEVRHYA